MGELREKIAQIVYDAFGEGEDTYLQAADNILALIRKELLDPEVAWGISDELFLHGFDDDIREVDNIPPIAIGVVIGHLFDQCSTCAEGEVRKVLRSEKG